MRADAILALALLGGCAAMTKTTPEQDFARAAWDSCPKSANLALDYIEPNGRIHYRAVSNVSGMRELEECVRDYYATHPGPTGERK